jgi:hypothetical protein
MGTGEFGMLIFSTISIIILSCMGIYGFKEGKKWTKEDKWYLYALGSLSFIGALCLICLIVHIVGGN